MSILPDAVGSKRRRDWPKHIVIWLVLCIELLPLYMMLQISFKDNASFIQSPWLPLLPVSVEERVEKYEGAAVELRKRPITWSEIFGGEGPRGYEKVIERKVQWDWSVYKLSNWSFGLSLILPYIANTVFVAVTGTVLSLLLAIMGAYFFARYEMPGYTFFWGVFMLLMLLPGAANIVPLFILLKSMSLLNTLWALIIVGVAGAQVFTIFVLRNFIEDLPKDLFEAAELDGASHFQQILNVVIPMSAPIIGTLAILSFLGTWNEYMLPLIVLRDKELFTLGVGLIFLDGEYVKDYGKIMASFFIAAIPLIVIFLFTMKLFVRGLSAGALKG